MKTKEELNTLKEEVETLNKKLAELDEDELKLVVGGSSIPGLEAIGPCIYLGRENSNPEKSCQNGSIQEVIGPWDIKVKLK